jgi:hypothetical protein
VVRLESVDRSENNAVVATYPARHYAEMARDFLSDDGIDAFIVADDVRVPLQLAEGAWLHVKESRIPAAYQALERAGLLPESIAP